MIIIGGAVAGAVLLLLIILIIVVIILIIRKKREKPSELPRMSVNEEEIAMAGTYLRVYQTNYFFRITSSCGSATPCYSSQSKL